MTTRKHDNNTERGRKDGSRARRPFFARSRCEVFSNTSHLSQFDNSNLYTKQILYYIFITTCIILTPIGYAMNREYALELIESRVDQYMNIPSELHRGFAMGLARFALESNLITADEYITYCDRMNEVSYNAK